MHGVCDAPPMGSAPEPGPDTEDPANSAARVLAEEQLADPEATWTMGFGGRFARRPDEPVSRGPGSAVTDRGGIRLTLPDGVAAIAYETPSAADPLRWDHAVAFCLPTDEAGQAGRAGVTELGPDFAALRPKDTADILFDLGIGGPFAEVCRRTSDPAALAALRAAVHGGELDLESPMPGVHRVLRTAGGRIETTAPSPTMVGSTAPTLPASAPVPAGWVPCVVLHPAHPAMDRTGRPLPFDQERHRAFQTLLDIHGDPVLGVLKAEVVDAVRAGRAPGKALSVDGPAARATVAVTIRQLALTDGTSGTWAAWRSRYGGG